MIVAEHLDPAARAPEAPDPEPVHNAFGLSYASYLVLPRSLMGAMPVEWQRTLVMLLAEMEETFEHWPAEDVVIEVWLRAAPGRGQRGRPRLRDPLADYRRPDRDLIERMRKRPGARA